MPSRTIKDLYQALEAWSSQHSPRTRSSLRGPVDADALRALEHAIGRALPADLRAALAIHDGRANLDGYKLLHAERIQDRYQDELAHADQASSHPQRGTCRPVQWSKGWIPFAEDGGLNFLCLDLDPGPSGAAGQVIRWERSARGADATQWKSFADWLGAIVDACLAGAVNIDAEGFVTLR